MKLFAKTVFILAAAVAVVRADPGDIIPRPSAVTTRPGEFALTPKTAIYIDEDDAQLKETAQVLVDLLKGPLGVAPPVSVAHGDLPAGSIQLTHQDTGASYGDGGYQLDVSPERLIIRATTDAGFFYGIQSLRQLLPPSIETQQKLDNPDLTIPSMLIGDSPRCQWRGMMLDVARHYFDKSEVEKVLDVMALHKLNVFHWHLVDDQGWRIEIKKYPKLTEEAAWRSGIGFDLDPKRSDHYRADGKYGGFYTQDDIREVVAYAAARHIMIVPEIEMPGHASAALSAYPEYSCDHKVKEFSGKAGVSSGVYDPANEATFQFIDDILTEVAGLFPGPYIHIGGDEVPKGPWHNATDCQELMKKLGLKNEEELQSYFIKRVETIVESKHKRLIGWDEILQGGLAPGALVMSWHGIGGAVTAAKAGHDVMLSPTGYAYLDYGQTKAKGQPKTIGGYLPLKHVYSFDPESSKLSPEEAKHVLGAQGNVWSEYIPNLQQVELMAFPRELAIAEVTWTPHDRTDFEDFQRRLVNDEKRLDAMHVNYFHGDSTSQPASAGEWHASQMSETPKELSWDVTSSITKPGTYQVTMQYTDGGCRLDVKWVAIAADGAELARDTHDGTTGAADKKNVYELKIPELKAGAKYTLTAMVRSDGGTDSNGTVTVEQKN